MKSNSTAFWRSISSTLIKPDPIRGLGSGFRIRRCFLRLLLTNRARCSRFQSWVGYTMTTEGQRKHFSAFTIQSRMSETGSTEHCDRVRVVPVFSVPCPRVCLANEIHMRVFGSFSKYVHTCSTSGGKICAQCSKQFPLFHKGKVKKRKTD